MKKIIFFLTFFVLGITSTFAFDASDNFSFTHSGSTYDVSFYPANNGNQYGATFDVKKDGSSYKGASGTRFHTDNSNHIIALPALSGYNFLGCYGVQQYYYNSTIWNGGYTWGYCSDKYIIKDNIFYAISGTIGGPYHISFTYDLSTYTTTYNGGSGAGAGNEVINYGLVTDYSELFDIPNEVFFPTNISSGNLVCETSLNAEWDYTNYYYSTGSTLVSNDDVNGILEYTKNVGGFDGNTESNFKISVENESSLNGFFTGALLDPNDSFTFRNKLFPLDSQAYIKIESGFPKSSFNYFEINGTGALFQAGECNTQELYFGGQELEYGEKYVINSVGGGTDNLCLFFARDSFNSNFITSVDFGFREEVYEESEYCYNEDSGEWSIDGEVVGNEPPDPSGLPAIDDSIQENDIIYDSSSNIIGASLNITEGIIASPYGEVGDSCDMFNSAGDFIYANGSSFLLNISLDNTGLPSFIISGGNLILKPINSITQTFFTAGSVFTPVTASMEGRKFCILGTVIEYQARPLLTGSDLRYKIFMLDYFFLLIYYLFLFKLFYYIRHNTLISMQ